MRRSRASRGTLGSIIEQYRSSDEFLQLRPRTKEGYDYALLKFNETLGEMPVEDMTRNLMRKFLSKFADRPATQKRVLQALRTVDRWAVGYDLMGTSMTMGIKVKGGTGAREPWTDAEIALALEHAREPLPRLILLAAETGQRAGDLVRMTWRQLDTSGDRWRIDVKQEKTDLALWIPVTRTLRVALETWDRSLGYMVTKADGTPYTRPDLSSTWYKEIHRNPALEPLRLRKLSFHGLRASAVIRLRRMGLTDSEVASIVGMSVPMVSRYSRRANQWLNAVAALDRLDGAERERNNVITIDRKPLYNPL